MRRLHLTRALGALTEGAAFGLIVALTLTTPSRAAVTIFGNDSNAQACYQAASLPMFGVGVESCDRAIKGGTLFGRDLAATHVNRSIILTSGNRYDDAMDDVERALKLWPNMPEAFVTRGNVHFMQRDFTLALRDYDEALARETRRPWAAHYNRGLALEQLGRIDEAVQAFRNAVTLNPDFGLAQQRLISYDATDAVTQ